MDHPKLIAVLADDQHRHCPCGAVGEQPQRLCRKCHARMAWRRKTTRTSRRAARRLAAHQAREGTRILASAMALLHAISKGVES
jgi:hypothetical protein